MINHTKQKQLSRLRRQRRVRAKIRGTALKPRLSVFRSATHIYAQLINDEAGKTLAASSDEKLNKKEIASAKKEGSTRQAKVAVAYVVGELIAEKAKTLGIQTVVFDRNGFSYSGRVAAVAEGARDKGLKF